MEPRLNTEWMNDRLWAGRLVYLSISPSNPGPPFPQIDIIGGSEQWRLSGGQEGKLSGLFCAVLCATIVHSELHTHMNRTNSSLDWVLSHWAHFTVYV